MRDSIDRRSLEVRSLDYLIEDFPCADIKELRQREGHYIKELATLNKQIAGRTSKTYYNDVDYSLF